MIITDHDRCNRCGICINICHEYCMQIEHDQLVIDHAYCSTCTQCIAVCPKDALSWDHVEPTRYNRELLPTPEQVDELLKQRRTIRDFKQEKVPAELLEEIVNYAVYAPTHSFNMRAIVVDNEDVIRKIDTAILNFSSWIYRTMYQPKFFRYIVRWFTPDREKEYMKARPKLEAARKRGRNFKTMPPALLMIIADRRVPLSLESAQYALYSINLYAHSHGLGCRNLVGNQMFLNRTRSMRNLLGLGKYEKIMGTMAVGYPAVKFRNRVEGKRIPLVWIH